MDVRYFGYLERQRDFEISQDAKFFFISSYLQYATTEQTILPIVAFSEQRIFRRSSMEILRNVRNSGSRRRRNGVVCHRLIAPFKVNAGSRAELNSKGWLIVSEFLEKVRNGQGLMADGKSVSDSSR